MGVLTFLAVVIYAFVGNELERCCGDPDFEEE